MAAILYYLRQDTREHGTALWYAKAYTSGTADLDYIAGRIQQNCSMKKSDVLAYLTELIELVGEKLKQGYKVQLGDLGIFSLGMKCKGSIDKKDWNPNEFCKGVKVNYQTTNTRSDGVTTRAILNNVSYVQTPYPYIKKTNP